MNNTNKEARVGIFKISRSMYHAIGWDKKRNVMRSQSEILDYINVMFGFRRRIEVIDLV